MKVCSQCNESKPLDEYYKRKESKDGHRANCKACHNAKTREYQKNNEVELREKSKKYRKDNADAIRKYREHNRERNREVSKRYYWENKEMILKQNKIWRKENKEHVRIRDKKHRERRKEYYREIRRVHYEKNRDRYLAYYEENRERYREYSRRHSRENRDMYNLKRHKRNAKERGLPATLTKEEWVEIKKNFNFECAYCGMNEQEHKENHSQQLHQDHVVPLSSDGWYVFNNIVPACIVCNASKGDWGMEDWYRRQKFYDKSRELVIQRHMNAIKTE